MQPAPAEHPERAPAKICRSCMTQDDAMQNLFEPKQLDDQAPLRADVLMDCAAVSVAENDGLPGWLCRKCDDRLSAAHDFKRQCERADAALRRLADPLPARPKACYLCGAEFDRSLHLINHTKTHLEHDAASLFCGECGLGFRKLANLLAHRKRHRRRQAAEGDRKGRVFECEWCSKVMTTYNGLKIHRRVHTGQNLSKCGHCEKSFTKSSHLKRHATVHEPPPKQAEIVCELCEKQFKTQKSYKHHMRAEHHFSDESDVPLSTIAKGEVAPIATTSNDVDSITSEDQPKISHLCYEPFTETEQLVAHINNHIGVDQTHEIKNENLTIAENRLADEPPGGAKRFECEWCFKVLTTSNGLKLHRRQHTGKNLVKCEYCEKTFTKVSHLKRHVAIHGLPPSVVKTERFVPTVLICEFCDKKFKYKKSYAHHMQTEHDVSDTSDSFGAKPEIVNVKVEVDPKASVSKSLNECHVCKMQFTRANHLARHMALHKDVLVHKCERCEKSFATVAHLGVHAANEHANKPYECNICSKQFGRAEHLMRHLKVHAAGAEAVELRCSVCERVFQRADALTRHLKAHLMQDKRHVCAECGKAFNRLDNLKNHQRVHMGDEGAPASTKLHLCIYCGKEFNYSSNMIVHMRRHTGERPYKCRECGKGFPRSHDLKCHERTHSGEKPYQCGICDKAFNKSNKLLRHSRVHTGERPYLCNICGRAFTQSNDLTLHMRRHTGARPYPCGGCPARFIQSCQLKAHRRSTGHAGDAPSELKGGHRVEPVPSGGRMPPVRFRRSVRETCPLERKEELIAEIEVEAGRDADLDDFGAGQGIAVSFPDDGDTITYAIVGGGLVPNEFEFQSCE